MHNSFNHISTMQIVAMHVIRILVSVLQGENDIEQLCCVLRVLGTPDEASWPVSMFFLQESISFYHCLKD